MSDISLTLDVSNFQVYMMIKSCWDEDPEKRPDFKKVENCLEKNIRYSFCLFMLLFKHKPEAREQQSVTVCAARFTTRRTRATWTT